MHILYRFSKHPCNPPPPAPVQVQPGFQARDARWNASMGGVVTRRIALPPDAATGAPRSLDLVMLVRGGVAGGG
mgnify:CR=1 FL=1